MEALEKIHGAPLAHCLHVVLSGEGGISFSAPATGLLVSVGLLAFLMVALAPRKQGLQQNFKDELAESKRTWKKWNR